MDNCGEDLLTIRPARAPASARKSRPDRGLAQYLAESVVHHGGANAGCDGSFYDDALTLGGRAARASPRSSGSTSRRPANWARMNSGASIGLIPAKLSVSARAMVTAGLAKDVEDVNQ